MAQPQDAASIADKAVKRPKKRGHLFIVDLPTFAKVCSLEDPDAAAAYLILAAGTGPDNRTSTWSREAINQRTALNWRKADAAMAKLEQNGLIRWKSGKGTRKPRIDLPPVETRPAMQRHVAALSDRIKQGDQPCTPNERSAATIGVQSGWFRRDEAGMLSIISERPLVKAYLPMELVGDAFGATSDPTTTVVDRIRMSRDPMALRLLVDLYALQDMAEHGGVDRGHFYRKCAREDEGATGNLKLWSFTPGGSWVMWNGALDHHRREPTPEEKKAGKNAGSDFFARTEILADAGALEWVYYLAEDESATAPLIYPVGVERHGKMVWTELEAIVGSYAARAACALSNDVPDKLEYAERWEASAPTQFILPADRLARQAALVGVPRLRHRTRTLNASRWRQELVESANGIIEMLRGIIGENAPALLEDADRRLADFKDASTMSSTLDQRDINDTYQSAIHMTSSLREDASETGLSLGRMAAWHEEAEKHFRATGERF